MYRGHVSCSTVSWVDCPVVSRGENCHAALSFSSVSGFCGLTRNKLTLSDWYSIKSNRKLACYAVAWGVENNAGGGSHRQVLPLINMIFLIFFVHECKIRWIQKGRYHWLLRLPYYAECAPHDSNTWTYTDRRNWKCEKDTCDKRDGFNILSSGNFSKKKENHYKAKEMNCRVCDRSNALRYIWQHPRSGSIDSHRIDYCRDHGNFEFLKIPSD